MFYLTVPEEKHDTCERTRCGANAMCHEQNGAVLCVCKPKYYGNPYLACHPECVLNSDCPINKACVNNHCENPCVGACGVGAHCEVANHHPVCFCPAEYTGDPFVACHKFSTRTYETLNIS